MPRKYLFTLLLLSLNPLTALAGMTYYRRRK